MHGCDAIRDIEADLISCYRIVRKSPINTGMEGKYGSERLAVYHAPDRAVAVTDIITESWRLR